MGCTQRKCNRRVQVSQGVSDLHPLLFDAEKVHTMGRGINRRSTLAAAKRVIHYLCYVLRDCILRRVIGAVTRLKFSEGSKGELERVQIKPRLCTVYSVFSSGTLLTEPHNRILFMADERF